jgi:hypothetical protein
MSPFWFPICIELGKHSHWFCLLLHPISLVNLFILHSKKILLYLLLLLLLSIKTDMGEMHVFEPPKAKQDKELHKWIAR